MRGRPPKRKLSPEQEKAAQAFIDGAKSHEAPEEPAESRPVETTPGGEQAPVDESEQTYPWEKPHVREDVVKGYSLRLPEPLYLKLKYLSNETGKSMNEICKQAVRGVIERELSQ